LSVPWFWRQLEIDPTGDRSAIRRAYSRLLKISNPEVDADAFQRLRAAYEMALAHADGSPTRAAASRPTGREAADPALSRNLPAPAEARAEPPAQDARCDPVPSPADPQSDLHGAMRRVQRRFDERGPLDEKTVRRDLEVILSSPRLEHIDVYRETEAWLAGLLEANLPRSDPFLARANARFRWTSAGATLDRGNLGWAIAERLEDLGFLARFRKTRHVYHRALVELTRPPTPRLSLRAAVIPGLASEVAGLLHLVRTICASLIVDLDPDAVAAWDDYRARRRQIGPRPLRARIAGLIPRHPMAIWAVFVLFGLVGTLLCAAHGSQGN
jgi:hypothetical protein